MSWTSNPPHDNLLHLAHHIFRGVGIRALDFVALEPAAGVVVTAVLDKTSRRRILAFNDVTNIRAAIEEQRLWFERYGRLDGATLPHWGVCVEPDPARRRAIVADLAREYGQPNRDQVLADCRRLERGW